MTWVNKLLSGIGKGCPFTGKAKQTITIDKNEALKIFDFSFSFGVLYYQQ